MAVSAGAGPADRAVELYDAGAECARLDSDHPDDTARRAVDGAFFGAGLQNFLDEGNTVALRRQIQTAITNSLQTYEARIAVDAVEVETVAGASSQIHVQIYYRLLRTNAPQQIGVTMQGG